ncbi:MAG: glycoside hydrolase family 43 protein [Oscillibacter sp.]|nr:glycoside hydrolase family 43 protein [Oscillibacter sp.]
MIQNPILPGFNPDPCICRKGEDFYIAVSSFEWFPGIPIYHSKDMKHWELYSHALQNADDPDLKKLPSAKGIWAPCLTYCEADDLFYVVYGVMNSMNARYFDVDNFLITAKDPKGPWSEPVYLHSTGFDASLFHDDDGKKYVVALEWETRTEYEKPGPISIMEYDPKQKKVLGMPKRFWRGGTDRGCIEAPHLTKRGDYYYIMCAEGGTGYYHSVTVGRSKNVWGPYEPDPCNPILTSSPENHNERHDWDHLKPHYYNPESKLQKSGHASYVDLPNGETWMVFHCSRPFLPELRCTLGRETAIERMKWTDDGWLRTENGGNLAREFVEESALPEKPLAKINAFDGFDSPQLALGWYAPRIAPASFVDLTSRPGWARLRGQESGCSQNKASILARKLTSVQATATTKLDFTPLSYQHTAGLILYYDNMNFLYLYKYFSETLNRSAIAVMSLENGTKTEFHDTRTPVEDGQEIWMRVIINGRASQFQWSLNGANWADIGPAFDTSKLSDEYSDFGEFTGTFVGIACGDRMTHSRTADFDFFDYQSREDADVK